MYQLFKADKNFLCSNGVIDQNIATGEGFSSPINITANETLRPPGPVQRPYWRSSGIIAR